jgi:Glyoxalase-like domain
MTATTDHLVYATPDLDATVEQIATVLGVRPAYGGQHTGLGTHNALLSLGPRVYLEIIAPDPAQPRPARPRPFGLDELSGPALRGWAAAPDNLDAALQRSATAGFDYGLVVAAARRTAEGHELKWRMTNSAHSAAVAVAPFLIDWADSAHPAGTAPSGATLAEFRLLSPQPTQLAAQLELLGVDVPIEEAGRPGLRAVIVGPGGARLTLDS